MKKLNSRQGELDQRLSGYSAGARKLRARVGNWPIYAAAAGSALAMTTNASASIISGTYTGSGPNGGVAVQPQPDGEPSVLGLLFSGGEINLRAASGLSSNTLGSVLPFAQLSVQGVGLIQIFQANSQNARNFGAGAMISNATAGNVTPNARIVAANFSSSNFGDFVEGQFGYVGFAFNVGGGHYDYGWLKVDFVKVGDIPRILEALAWGIELNPDQGIRAGDMGTPEPGTLGLGILAAGAAGVVALRRHRKQQQAA